MIAKHWKPIAFGFCCGLLAGAVALGLWSQSRRQRWRDPEKKREYLIRKFSTRLELDDAQRSKVRAILEDEHRRMDELHEDWRSKFSEVRESARAEILEVLRPAQQETFREMTAEWEARRRKRHGRRGPPKKP